MIRPAVGDHAAFPPSRLTRISSCLSSPPAALGGVLTFFFHYDTDFPEVLEFTHATNKSYGWGRLPPAASS